MGAHDMVPRVGESEIACQSQRGGVITSGGGFSSYYAASPWQVDHQSQYLSDLTMPPDAGFNANGRGLPDVSLIGVDYSVYLNGEITSVFGTSCSRYVNNSNRIFPHTYNNCSNN